MSLNMSNKGALDDLKTFISIQTDEELVWALHVFNEWYEQLGSYDYRTREQNNSGLNSDIDCLNSFKHLKDIKSYILKICESYHRDEIDDLLGRLIDFKSKINVSVIAEPFVFSCDTVLFKCRFTACFVLSHNSLSSVFVAI